MKRAKFVNGMLASEIDILLSTAKQVNKNGYDAKAYTGAVEDAFSYPWFIEVEDISFFYPNEQTRNLDFSQILQIFAEQKIKYTQKKQ